MPKKPTTRAAGSRKTQPAADHDIPTLSRERVLAAALDLIDQNGMEGFSVRDLARTLGVFPTAIYWYVESRNALISGAVSHVLQEVTPPKPSGDWRKELMGLFKRYRQAVRRHPNIASVVGAQLVSNESMDPAFMESILALLQSAGFPDAELVRAYNVVIAGMVGFVTMELAAMPVDDPEGWARSHREHLMAASAERYPTLARLLPKLMQQAFILRSANGVEQPMNSSFEAWVTVCLHGLEALRPDSGQR